METQNPYESPQGDLTNEEGFGEIRFFSPGCRIGRIRYLSHGMLVTLVMYTVLGIITAIGVSGGSDGFTPLLMLLMIPFYIFFIYASVLFMVQRLHDLNQSGWWWLLMIIPLINIGMMIWLVFFPGTEGSNNYGKHPPPNKLWNWILGTSLPIVSALGIVAAIALPAYQDYATRAKAAQQQFIEE